MLDLGFSDSLLKLNFIGVVSLFGGEIALSALRYTVLTQNVLLSLYFTMILSSGLQTVSLKMFKRMEDKASKAISGGPRDNKKDIIGLSASKSYKYVGLHSGTKMVVANILGEALIKASRAETPTNVYCSRDNPPRRNLKLKVIELDELHAVENEGTPDKEYGFRMCVTNQPFGYRTMLLYTIPLITIAGIVVVLLAQDYKAFALVLLNVVCNMSVMFTIRSNGIRYPTGHSAYDSPRGDIFVETNDGTEMYLVIGNEDTIQYAFQKPLVMPPNPDNKMWKYLHISTAYSSYITVVVNIILLPFSTIGGQIIFGVLILLGVIQNMLLSTFDGDELLLSMTENLFAIRSTREYIFQARSSAIAFCMLRSRSNDVGPLRHLLPDTRTFEIWFGNVINAVDGIPSDTTAEGLLRTLNMDLQDALREYNKPD